MSESITASIHYAVPYTAKNTRRLLEAVARAFEANWVQENYDAWSGPGPSHLVEVETWAIQARPDNLGTRIDAYEPLPDSTPFFDFSISPVTRHTASIKFKRMEDGKIWMFMLVPRSILLEHRGSREQADLVDVPVDDRDDDWYDRYEALEYIDPTYEVAQQSVAAVLRIVDALKAALPVRTIDLDQRLENPLAHIPGQAERDRQADPKNETP